MNINDYKNIYMIGIGGVSMSGIAEILLSWGFIITGSDNAESKYTNKLISSGIKVNIGQVEDNIDDSFDLVVYTAAISDDNPELVKARALNIPCVERGLFLGYITQLFANTIGISGTHGKTSTTSMVASCFLEGNMDPSIQVGSVLPRINGNYLVGKSDTFIIEACEYHDSYLNFNQKSAIVLNIDNDHLDYFKTIDNIEKSFQKYVSHLPSDGYLVVNSDDERCAKLGNYTQAKVITTGIDQDAMYMARDISFNYEGCAIFSVYKKNILMGNIELGVSGLHMVRNALCCIALCDQYGIKFEDIQKGLLSYKGASRRLEYKGIFNGAKVYDDYGHHPTEIDAVAKAIKEKKHNESWAIWEGHTYNRVFEHQDGFVNSLKTFDHIIVIDIFAARDVNTMGITPDMIVDKLKLINKDAIHISDYNEIVNYLKDRVHNDDIIITLGAGDVNKISDLLVK
ncbi:MAG: UDP-N-acetylmuramate--L-alanine ligase [Bacilli bacterium]